MFDYITFDEFSTLASEVDSRGLDALYEAIDRTPDVQLGEDYVAAFLGLPCSVLDALDHVRCDVRSARSNDARDVALLSALPALREALLQIPPAVRDQATSVVCVRLRMLVQGTHNWRYPFERGAVDWPDTADPEGMPGEYGRLFDMGRSDDWSPVFARHAAHRQLLQDAVPTVDHHMHDEDALREWERVLCPSHLLRQAARTYGSTRGLPGRDRNVDVLRVLRALVTAIQNDDDDALRAAGKWAKPILRRDRRALDLIEGAFEVDLGDVKHAGWEPTPDRYLVVDLMLTVGERLRASGAPLRKVIDAMAFSFSITLADHEEAFMWALVANDVEESIAADTDLETIVRAIMRKAGMDEVWIRGAFNYLNNRDKRGADKAGHTAPPACDHTDTPPCAVASEAGKADVTSSLRDAKHETTTPGRRRRRAPRS